MYALFTNDSAAAARRLVGERAGILGDNTQSIDAVASEAEHLRKCFETLEKSNSTIVAILVSQEQEKLSEQQIAEMLRNLSAVMTADVPKLTTDLQQVCQNTSVLRELVQKMRDLKVKCEAAIKRLESVSALDQKSNQGLTVLRGKAGKAIQAGLPQTCHDGLFLV